MYLHLGSDTVISEKDIIGIFDLENTSTGQITREFLNKNNSSTITVSNNTKDIIELPKAFIVTNNVNTKKERIFISPISVATLKKRYININNL